jgi:hypothetical protein
LCEQPSRTTRHSFLFAGNGSCSACSSEFLAWTIWYRRPMMFLHRSRVVDLLMRRFQASCATLDGCEDRSGAAIMTGGCPDVRCCWWQALWQLHGTEEKGGEAAVEVKSVWSLNERWAMIVEKEGGSGESATLGRWAAQPPSPSFSRYPFHSLLPILSSFFLSPLPLSLPRYNLDTVLAGIHEGPTRSLLRRGSISVLGHSIRRPPRAHVGHTNTKGV